MDPDLNSFGKSSTTGTPLMCSAGLWVQPHYEAPNDLWVILEIVMRLTSTEWGFLLVVAQTCLWASQIANEKIKDLSEIRYLEEK